MTKIKGRRFAWVPTRALIEPSCRSDALVLHPADGLCLNNRFLFAEDIGKVRWVWLRPVEIDPVSRMPFIPVRAETEDERLQRIQTWVW